MDKVYIESALRPEGHYSPAVSDGKYIYVSGQLPIDPFTGEACRGGVAEQTRRVLENIRKAKAGIKKAMQNQVEGLGFSFVELLTNCPTNWHMSPVKTLEFMEEHTMKYFPCGVFVDKTAKEAE